MPRDERTNRRAVLTGLGVGALVRAGPARGQGTARRRVTIIMGIGRGAEGEGRLRAFQGALAGYGWRPEGRLDLTVVWAEGDPGTVRNLVRQVVDTHPDVIVATATPIAVALKEQRDTPPVVFVNLVDPVGAGLVESISAPGTNFTGLTNTEALLASKWLELLKEMAPAVQRAGFLFHPAASPFRTFRQALERAARTLSLSVLDLPVTEPDGIDPAVARCRDQEATGLVVMTDVFTSTHYRTIIAATARYAVPSVYPYRFFVAHGGLMSYSADLLELYARAAGYVDRVLNGAKPADMPVQMPSKYELVVNSRTAASLGLTIPASIAARTDEFIE
jgi:putative ABC transport system substrate-binding protein